MGRSVSTFVPIAIAAIATALIGASAAAAAAECVTRAELDGAVSPATADYLVRAVDRAEDRCAALLVRVDTPGGRPGGSSGGFSAPRCR
jgi:membrane-bound serine protease (ClpP class)